MQNSKSRQKCTFPFFFRFFSSCFRFLPHFLMNFPLFRLYEVATLLVASNDAPMLIHDSLRNMNSEDSNIVLDGNFRQIMSGVSEAYINAESWQLRREILSIVATKIPLKFIVVYTRLNPWQSFCSAFAC